MRAHSQPPLPREVSMPLAAGYFDESSDEGIEDRSYCVAGFVGNGAAALELDMRWGDLLGKYDLDYFKSSEIEFGFGQFAKHRYNPSKLTDPLTSNEKALIREIKTAFIDLICDCEEMIGIGCVLLIRDYELLRSESPHAAKVLPVPYVLCANLTLLEAGNMANEANSINSYATVVRPVFDSHLEHGPRFLAAFDSYRRNNPISATYLLPPHYEVEQKYRCLQAADCLAYEARRLLIRDEYEPHREVRVAMTRLSEQVGKIYKLDYESLKIIADAQAPDRIPIKPAITRRTMKLNRSRVGSVNQ
jgi:hypothetical protein